MFKRYLYINYRSFSSLKYRLARRVTPMGWLLICGTFIAGALGLDTNLSVAYQTFALLFCILIGCVVSIFFNRAQISVSRILPKFGSAGEPLRYRLLVENKSSRLQSDLSLIEDPPDPRPTFDEFANCREPGEEKRNWFDRTYCYYRWQWLLSQNSRAQTSVQAVPNLPPNNRREFEAQLTPLRRGVLRLNSATVAAPDLFGCFRSLKKIPTHNSILVLPKRYAIPHFEFPGTVKYQLGGVSLASSIGESEEFISLREYRAGDPLRRIHWKSFAKAGKPISKEFQDEFFVRHALVLDTFTNQPTSDVFEEAVSVAASLACTVDTQDSLLDLMFVGPKAFCFTAGRGVGHTEQMLEILASVQPCRDKDFKSLETLILNHVSDVSGCICVFISWDEQRKAFVSMLRSLGVPLLVFVITQTDGAVEPGPLADAPECSHVLPVGKIAEKLAQL